MTKFQDPSFSSPANSKKYRDNYDRIFGKKKAEPSTCSACSGGKRTWEGYMCALCGETWVKSEGEHAPGCSADRCPKCSS